MKTWNPWLRIPLLLVDMGANPVNIDFMSSLWVGKLSQYRIQETFKSQAQSLGVRWVCASSLLSVLTIIKQYIILNFLLSCSTYISQKVEQKQYRSLEEFEANAQDMVHTSAVYYGVNSDRMRLSQLTLNDCRYDVSTEASPRVCYPKGPGLNFNGCPMVLETNENNIGQPNPLLLVVRRTNYFCLIHGVYFSASLLLRFVQPFPFHFDCLFFGKWKHLPPVMIGHPSSSHLVNVI